MIDKETNSKKEQELFQQYAILTDELLKFVKQEDIDTFLHIMSQREKIGEKILTLSPLSYPATEEGKTLLESVEQKEKAILLHGKAFLNREKTKTEAVRSYDILKTDLETQSIGIRLNQET